MLAASSSTTSSGGSSGRPMRAARSNAASSTSRTIAVKTGASRSCSRAGRAAEQRPGAAGDEPRRIDLAAFGRGRDGRIGEGGDDRLRRRVHRGPLALLAAETGPRRPQCLGNAGELEREENLGRLFLVQPSDDVGHRGAGARGSKQQWGEQLLGIGVPEAGVLHAPVPGPRDRAQRRSHPPGSGPGDRPCQGRPSRRPESRPASGWPAERTGRVVALHFAERRPPLERLVEQVGLDARGEDGARPLEDRRDRQRRRLARLRRADDHDRVTSFGREQAAGVGAEHDAVTRRRGTRSDRRSRGCAHPPSRPRCGPKGA